MPKGAPDKQGAFLKLYQNEKKEVHGRRNKTGEIISPRRVSFRDTADDGTFTDGSRPVSSLRQAISFCIPHTFHLIVRRIVRCPHEAEAACAG
jgi:hypothetical protein